MERGRSYFLYKLTCIEELCIRRTTLGATVEPDTALDLLAPQPLKLLRTVREL